MQQVGVLASGHEVLPIFGRPTYPGSHRWNYYTATNDAIPLRLPVQNKKRECDDDNGCDEIFDGDEGVVSTFPDKSFTATIYSKAGPRYLPHVL